MIISEKKYQKTARREKWIILSAILFLLSCSIWLFYQVNKKQVVEIPEHLIYCDAENVKADKFITGGLSFFGGKLQSREKSHSGNFSCKIEQGKGIQYGFGYHLKNVQPGEVYKVSVWRYKTPQKEGRLVIQNSGGDDFYQIEEFPVQVSPSGWEKLESVFVIPFGQKPDYYNIYVFASGLNIVYFDDLKIEKVGQWPKNAMNPTVLDIKIEAKSMRKLEKKREEALVKGLLQTSDNDWVKAILMDSLGNEIPAQLRLKGDWTDHLQADKWSFRIKVKSGNSWKYSNKKQNGLITFSVHNPAARYFLSEWLVHQCWAQEGILTTRYDFTEVRLNGKSLGIYAIEEHFEKQLLESQQRREGPIVKFSEEGMWAGIDRQLQNQGYIHFDYRSTVSDWENAETETFGQKKIQKSPLLRQQYEAARQLMFDYKNGLKPAAEVFDLEKLAKYYAIADVFNAYHGIVWHNQRFYFNPLTGKLEPIGFDAFGSKPPRRYTILGEGALNPNNREANRLFGYLLQDEAFCSLYFNNLYRYSSRDFLAGFLDKNQVLWSRKLKLLQIEFPEYQPDYKGFLEDGLFVHSLILPFNHLSLKAFTQTVANGKKTLSVQNTHQLPIQIIGFGYSRKQMDVELENHFPLPSHLRRRYLSRIVRDSSIIDFTGTRFLHTEALLLQDKGEVRELEVSSNARFLFFKLPGIDSTFTSRIFAWKRPKVDKVAFDPPEPFNEIKDNSLFSVNGTQVLFHQGKHSITTPVVFPKGYEIFMKEGTELDLKNGSYLMSYSPIQVFGSEEKPVIITSGDKSGQGIILLQTQRPSVFKHIIFDGLGALENNKQQLTGAVTIYESNVRFYRCAFQNNHSEDAINLIRSTFTIEKCAFSDISSDAIDSDFSKGEIKNCHFSNITNDAMDFSGSVVNIYNCQIRNTGDKGISCGEESDISVFDTIIDSSPIAVASKDLSVLFLRNISIKNCQQGFVAYQKKPEFGPGKIIVESYTAENIGRLQNIGEGSFLQM